MIDEHLIRTGLRCLPNKSELLLYRLRRRGRKLRGWIVLTLMNPNTSIIHSDSRAAMRALAISKQPLAMLKRKVIKPHRNILFPAHIGEINGAPANLNKSAHNAARELVNHATTKRENGEVSACKVHFLSYNELTKHFYLGRRVFPLDTIN